MLQIQCMYMYFFHGTLFATSFEKVLLEKIAV